MARGNADIQVRRVYDDDIRDGSGVHGKAFLVDGMWPRGVKREDLPIDGWLRDLAPSAELRRWFGHRAQLWQGFREKYRKELDGKSEALAPLLKAARQGAVTLLYATKETEHNNAVVLRDYLEDVLHQNS